MKKFNSRKLVKDIIEWDVDTWKKTLFFWNTFLKGIKKARVLEIGCMNGGLSLFFGLKKYEIVCSDLGGPRQEAFDKHKEYGVMDTIGYKDIDTLNIDFPDEAFDIVCFKSVLGGVGRNNSYSNQKRAIKEMRRVLKPGGKILFAENLRATGLHMFLRNEFIRGRRSWRYLSFEEIPLLFNEFTDLELQFYGFFSVLGRSEFQRSLLHCLDIITNSFIKDKCKYVVFGCATK
jgi:SAM-dependent methyltransferase